MGRRPRIATALVAVLGVLAGLLVAVAPLSAPAAEAATPSEFNPAYIISDDKFYDGTSVSQADAQAFLNWVSPGCQAGYTCLKDYRQDTWTRPGDSECRTYTGEAGESAARIIVKVAQACGIGARVLIVTLQKEQGLVTSTAPTQAKYDRAMGYACPDTAPCNAQFLGFFNQVYKAAWQLKRYGNSSTFTYFPVGRQVSMRYHPNAACGGLPLTILNKATAALYYYTPYTPNAAAMRNLYGTGDACSSYGNRNFWRFYTDWFGSPTALANPFGYLDGISTAQGGLRITGWTADPEAPTTPLWVQVRVDGTLVATLGSWLARPDVPTVHPQVGQFQGFDRVIPATPGTHTICATAMNLFNGIDSSLGCLSGTAGGGTIAPQPDLGLGAPRGWLDSVTTAPGGATVTGWALDPEIAAPIAVEVTSDGVLVQRITAERPHAEVGRIYPGYGPNHAFRETVQLTPGAHTVCVKAVGYGFGGDAALGCTRVTAGSGAPFGWLDSAAAAPGGVAVTGWAIDPDTAAPITVDAYVDGVKVSTLTAGGTKANLDASFPGYGDLHGFSGTVPTTAGRHTVCLYGQGPAPLTSGLVGCATTTVSTGAPIGYVDAWSTGPGTATIGGWSIDPDTAGPVTVQAYVDGALVKTAAADAVRTDVGAVHPGYGPAHGYSITVPVASGRHQVCARAVDDRGAGTTQLGCVSVTISTGAPIGYLDASSTGPGSVTVGGWSIDPDTAGPVTVHAYLDGVMVKAVTADAIRNDVAAVHPGYGAAHGYTVTLPAAPGRHQVCTWALDDRGAGNPRLGCATLTVGTGAPMGYIDSIKRTPAGVVVGGWAIDPDTADTVAVTATVNGVQAATGTADVARADVALVHPGFGGSRGYSLTLPASFTAGTVCVTARNVGPGADSRFNCVAIPAA